MMGRLLFLALLFSVNFCSPGLAAELSLQECVDLALRNNSGLKAADEELAAAREGMAITRADFFPVLTLEGGYSLLDQPERLIFEEDSFAAAIPPEDVEVSVGDESFYKLDLILKQPLFTGGRITHAYGRSRSAHQEAMQQVARRKREITRDVQLTFHEALNAQLYSETVSRAAQAKQERLRVLQELKGEGYAGKEHLLQQQTDVLFTELELIKSKNREQIAQRRLAHLMGYEADPEQLRLSGKFFNATLTASLGDLVEAAVRQREELLSASSRVEGLGEEVAIARSGYYPQLFLEGRYTHQKETSLTREDVWVVGAQLEWPLFEGGKTSAEVRKKVAEKRRAQHQRREIENSVRLETEQLWRGVKEGEKAIVAHSQQVKTTEFLWTMVVERYREGKVKLLELIEAEADHLKAYYEYLMAINDFDASMARLEAAVSQSLEPWLLPAEIYTPNLDFSAGRVNPRKPDQKLRDASGSLPVSQGDVAALAGSVPGPAVFNESGGFEVQAGSFKNRRNADQFLEFLTPKIPFNKIIVQPTGDFYRIRIVSFESKQAARMAMEQASITDYFILRTRNER